MLPPDDDGSAIARLLSEARQELDRVRVQDLAAEFAAGALVVDIRPSEQRRADGDGSSLAAHTLRSLGLSNATDLIGGFQDWVASGSAAHAVTEEG